MAATKCQKCGKVMEENNFYTYRNGEKTELCKECLTMNIDSSDESTFLWLLEKMDVPYVQSEWTRVRDWFYARDPEKIKNGMSIFGKYLARMRLYSWKNYRWADTAELNARLHQKINLYDSDNNSKKVN